MNNVAFKGLYNVITNDAKQAKEIDKKVKSDWFWTGQSFADGKKNEVLIATGQDAKDAVLLRAVCSSGNQKEKLAVAMKEQATVLDLRA